MPNYEEIKAELEKDLAEITPVIKALDDLREEKRAASPEESRIINELEIRSTPKVIALMLESKAQKRNHKLSEQGVTREYNPFILADDTDI